MYYIFSKIGNELKIHDIYRFFTYGLKLKGNDWNSYSLKWTKHSFCNSNVFFFPFFSGFALFLYGMKINIGADSALRNLRRIGETTYKIPTGQYLILSCKNCSF